jgi:hypothetical protein
LPLGHISFRKWVYWMAEISLCSGWHARESSLGPDPVGRSESDVSVVAA